MPLRWVKRNLLRLNLHRKRLQNITSAFRLSDKTERAYMQRIVIVRRTYRLERHLPQLGLIDVRLLFVDLVRRGRAVLRSPVVHDATRDEQAPERYRDDDDYRDDRGDDSQRRALVRRCRGGDEGQAGRARRRCIGGCRRRHRGGRLRKGGSLLGRGCRSGRERVPESQTSNLSPRTYSQDANRGKAFVSPRMSSHF